jgi:hypothetical protein
LNDLPPEAIKKYQQLFQDGKEPMATKEELLTMFKRRRPEYGQEERMDNLYPGEEVDYLHRHSRKDGRSMPCDWLGAAASQVPPGKTIAFLGPKARCQYIVRDKRPATLEIPQYEEWVEEPFERPKSPVLENEEVRHEPDARRAKPTRTQLRRAHRKAKRTAEEASHESYEENLADETGKAVERQQRVEDNPPPRGRGSEALDATNDERGRVIETRRLVCENPPPEGEDAH